jgi:hypothetical protein
MEPAILNKELHSMDVRLTGVEEKLDSVDQKVSQIVDAIVGNPLTKEGGLSAEILDLKKKVSELEDFKKRVYWTIGFIIAITMYLTYITTVYVNLKNNDKSTKNLEKNAVLGQNGEVFWTDRSNSSYRIR